MKPLENLAEKSQEYKAALQKYYQNPWYLRIELLTGIIIVTLQVVTLCNLFLYADKINFFMLFFILCVTYLMTDFINGVIHMVVDNNICYSGLTGPFVAAFHIHHVKLQYDQKSILKLYFFESTHKLWLAIYLIVLFIIQNSFTVNFYLNTLLVFIGVFSSLAELSHYWCHKATACNPLIRFLQKSRLLLSIKHHRIHHCHDNMNYAFLNGITDPVLNIIAKRYFLGYKMRADKHSSGNIT